MIEARFFDALREPILCSDGYWRMETAYTMYSQRGYVHYYGVDGEPIIVP